MDQLIAALGEAFREVSSGPRALAALEAVISIGLILIGTAVAIRLSTALIRRTLGPRGEQRFLDEARVRTLRPLLESLVRYVAYFIALVMVLRQAGVDATAILASAGVVGLAIGFGAQHLIRDVIAGFFLLAEGLIQVGDFIAFGTHSGVVERISIRTTQIRTFNGELWTIPNGELNVFGSLTRDFMRAIVEVGIPYEGDARRAMAVLRKVGEEWAAERRDIVLAPPEVQGIVKFGESGVTIRLVVTVKPLQQWTAEQELRTRIKEAFDREGMGIPYPRRVTYIHQAPSGGDAPHEGQR